MKKKKAMELFAKNESKQVLFFFPSKIEVVKKMLRRIKN